MAAQECFSIGGEFVAKQMMQQIRFRSFNFFYFTYPVKRLKFGL